MKFVVLAKQVPDTGETRTLDAETGLLDRAATEALPDEITERALELALRAKETDGTVEVVVLTVGPEGSQTTLRKMLSMGADRAVHVVDDTLAGSDMLQTAKVLAAALKHEGFDVVLAGNQSTDGRGGLVPAMVAELLDVPLLSDLSSFGIDGTQLSGTMRTDTSEIQLVADYPAVVAVTERVAEARFPSFKGIMAAKKKPTDKLTLSDLGIQAGPAYAPVRSVMVSAAGAPPKQTGPKFDDDGAAAAKLVDFLESRHLL
jgi:electron transfer flavoprotein beta subunit